MAKRRAQCALKQDKEADIYLDLDSGFFADGGPVPPVALFARELGVAGLGDGADECVVDAGVHAGVGELAEAVVEFVAVAFCQGWDGVDAEEVEVLEHGAADTVEVGELAGVFGGAWSACGGHGFLSV